jgi:hypothetical protein
MPRGVKNATTADLPALTFEVVKGESFMQVKAAAKLAGIHPTILEMGQRLLKRPDGEGAEFTLGTPDLLRRANDIETMFVAGLKKVARALGPGGLSVKCFRDEKRLVFWYAPGGPGRPAHD